MLQTRHLGKCTALYSDETERGNVREYLTRTDLKFNQFT